MLPTAFIHTPIRLYQSRVNPPISVPSGSPSVDLSRVYAPKAVLGDVSTTYRWAERPGPQFPATWAQYAPINGWCIARAASQASTPRFIGAGLRSEERRVGKACRCRWYVL